MAQKTDAQLTTQKDEIKNETVANANTQTRVGQMIEDIIDSKVNNNVLVDLNTTSVAGGTITLDCDNQKERMFVGSASFGTAKAVTLSNDSSTLVINLVLTLTNVAAALTFDSEFTMQTTDSRWNDSTKVFTPAATGKHEFSATWDGTDWNMKVTNPYA